MANKNFKVRFGLEAPLIAADNGTTAITLTGNDVTVADQLTVSGILDVQGGTITDSTGALSITTGAADGNITLDPNGTGDVALTLANGGNLTNTRNYVQGAIRNATTESIGDIWAVNSTGPANPYRGVSLDNSSDTTRGPATVLRSYSGGAVAGSATRGRIVFEKARGTAASPTAVQIGDILGSIDATGYTSTGFINDNVASVVPAFFGFTASENWVSNTNMGTTFSLSQAPSATTISSGANLVITINSSAESMGLRGDRLALAQIKTVAFTATGCSVSGTTLTIGTLTAGTIAVGHVITSANSGTLINHYIVANVSGSGSGSTWIISGSPGTLSGQAITGNVGIVASNPAGSATTDVLQDLRLLKNTIKSQGGTTQIATTFAGTILELRGDEIQLENAAASPLTGNKISYGRQYIEAYSTQDQTNPVANTENLMTFNNTGLNNGISIVSNSRITVSQPGVYNLQFSAQLSQTSGGAANTFIWLKKNGVNVANTAGDTQVAGNGDKIMASWNYLIEATAANDYFELAWSASNTSVILDYIAATGPVPAIPSVIVSVVPVGA